jgi:hypothetical protein
MEYKEIIPFSLITADIGYRNQILGAFHAIADLTGNKWNDEDLFILPENCQSIQDVKTVLCASNFESYMEFKKQIFILLDKYFSPGQKFREQQLKLISNPLKVHIFFLIKAFEK